MPLNLSTIQKATEPKELTLDFGDLGSIEMVIQPAKFTIGRQRRLHAAIKARDNAAVADMYAEVIQSWDLMGPDGKPIPLTPDGMDLLTEGTLNTILFKMAEALAVPKEETASA